jgi:chorismate mutase
MWVEFSLRLCGLCVLVMALTLSACTTSAPIIEKTEGAAPVAPTALVESIAEPDIEKINTVLTLTRELLLLAPDVARVNWKNKASPENKSRDESQLRAIEQAAIRYQTDPELVRDYFQGLIEADRYVQTELHKQWRSQGIPLNITLTRTPAQLKRAASELNPQLLAALSHLPAVLRKKGTAMQIQARALEIFPNRSALSEPIRNIVIAPLLSRASN